MTDFMILQDSPSFFDTIFKAYGFSFMSVHPSQISSPFLPPASVIILPSGFGNPEYSKTAEFFCIKETAGNRKNTETQNDSEIKDFKNNQISENNQSPENKKSQDNLAERLFRFSSKGGTVIFFSPLKNGFDLSSIGFEGVGISGYYHQKEIILPENEKFVISDEIFCDGFLEIPDISEKCDKILKYNESTKNEKIANDESEKNDEFENREKIVFIEIKAGNGYMVMTTIHEAFSEDFFKSYVKSERFKI